MFYNRIRLSSDKIIIIMLIKIFELFTKNTFKTSIQSGSLMNVINVFEVVPKGYERYNICWSYFDERNKCPWIFSSRRRERV